MRESLSTLSTKARRNLRTNSITPTRSYLLSSMHFVLVARTTRPRAQITRSGSSRQLEPVALLRQELSARDSADVRSVHKRILRLVEGGAEQKHRIAYTNTYIYITYNMHISIHAAYLEWWLLCDSAVLRRAAMAPYTGYTWHPRRERICLGVRE